MSIWMRQLRYSLIMKRDLYDVYSSYATHNHEVELSSLIQYSVEQGKKVLIADIRGLPGVNSRYTRSSMD